jgi:hypothetical protein
MNAIANKFFAADLAACIRLNDVRKTENAAARARMRHNPELCSVLLAAAQRRGEAEINWAEYFRGLGV